MNNNNKKYRNYLIKTYNHLYEKDYNMDFDKCYYCGDSCSCFDHRPALSLLPNLNIKDYLKSGRNFLLIPSCLNCNKYLYNKDFYSFDECFFYLMDKYNKKLNKIPTWTESEIKELGYNIKNLISANDGLKDFYIKKLEYIKLKIIQN